MPGETRKTKTKIERKGTVHLPNGGLLTRRGVVIEPDGRVYYDWLRHNGWVVSLGAIDGQPYYVEVKWPSSGGHKVTVVRGMYRDNYNLPVASITGTNTTYHQNYIRKMQGYRPKTEFLGALVRQGSTDLERVWYPDLSSILITYKRMGQRWSFQGQKYFIGEEEVADLQFDAYHRGSIFGLTRFRVGRLVNYPEVDALIQTRGYVGFYEENPWVANAIAANPCGPAGKALAVILTEGFHGLHLGNSGQPKPGRPEMLQWLIQNLGPGTLSRIPQPRAYPGSCAAAPSRGARSPQYICPQTGDSV